MTSTPSSVSLLTVGDESLMESFQAGEEAAFRILFDRYAQRLVHFAYRFFRSAADAEDLAQDVLARVFLKKAAYQPNRPFRPWLFAIAAHLVSNRLRDRARHPTDSLEASADEGEDWSVPEVADATEREPADRLTSRDAVSKIYEALDSLPMQQRQAVILARFEEMSYEEIASTLNLSVSAVKSLLFRAKQSLLKHVGSDLLT